MVKYIQFTEKIRLNREDTATQTRVVPVDLVLSVINTKDNEARLLLNIPSSRGYPDRVVFPTTYIDVVETFEEITQALN